MAVSFTGLLGFTTLTFILTWPLLALGRNSADPWIYNAAAMLIVGLNAALMYRILRVRPVFTRGMRRTGAVAVAAFGVVLLAFLPGLHKSWSLDRVGELVLLFLAFMALNVLPALGEELGWRGLLTGRLCDKLGVSRGVLVSSIVWAVWHTPAITGEGVVESLLNLALVALHGLWIAFLYLSGGLLVSWVYHAVFISVRDALVFLGMLLGRDEWLATLLLCGLGGLSFLMLLRRPGLA